MPQHYDPVLIAQRQKIEEELPQPLHKAYTSIMQAGMAILFSEETHGEIRKTLSHIQQMGNKPQDIANGMIEMLGMIIESSKGKIDMDAAFPALVTLTTQVLDYGKTSMNMTITKDFLDQVLTALARTYTRYVSQEEAAPAQQNAGLLAQPQAA